MNNTHPALLHSCALLAAFSASTLPAQVLSPAQTNPQAPFVNLPQPPILPADKAPTPPHILCQHGLLTISAENSTLRSILQALQPCVIATIAIPPAQDGRSWIALGPGPMREVLDQLLAATNLNYVLEPSVTDPDKFQSVLLMARPQDADDASGSANGALLHNRDVSSARAAWLASREAAEHPTEAAVQNDQSPTADSSSTTRATPPANDTAADPQALPPTPPQAEAGSVPNPPSSENTAQPSDAEKQLHNQITGMQQLFEQRKQMADPNATPPPASPPN